MKKILLVMMSALMIVGVARAQTQTQDRTQDKTQDQLRDQTQKRDRIHSEDHLMMRDGKLYQVKNGEMLQLREQLRLKNGATIEPNGMYQLANQEKYQLRNGECMDMDGNRYLNQNRFNQRKMMTNKEIERYRNMIMRKNNPPKPAANRQGMNGNK
ncbi:DUF6799 domain-containing protein [Hydrotalea sp.]|uniref:DUF6799 domain-containing protein n=1 Tax=Hydrotalea sp. TaxID=2881279 RepID=UPI003D14D6EF